MVDLRKCKEDEKFNDKQARRQKMIDKQSEYLASIKSKENDILDKQVREVEEKKLREKEEKDKKLDEMKVN